MAFGMFDLQKFCRDCLLPCLLIQDQNNGILSLDIIESKLALLIKKCENQTLQDFAFTKSKISIS